MALRETTVGQIADLLKASNRAGIKACLLIGAGVSKTAGIGLASDFVGRIKADFPEVYKATCAEAGADTEPGYAQCMAALPPATQVSLVREDIDKARINWAHIGIARLERAEIVDSILTPNFDPLASRACALFHRFPAIYDLAGLRDDRANRIDFDRSYVKGSAIFHLHGQHTGFLLLNTEKKLIAQAKRIRPVLDAAMKGKPVIIAGYSGLNDPLVDEIAQLAPFNHGLFWVIHDDSDPPQNVRERLLRLDNCSLVRSEPSDKFFTDLANALKLEPPQFMVNPFAHMLGILGTIKPYAEDSSSAQDELLTRARKHLERADEIAANGTDSATTIAGLMAAGEYEVVLRQFAAEASNLEEEARDQVAWAAIELGTAAWRNSPVGDAEAIEASYMEAQEKYATALSIKPGKHEALHNWGIVLSAQALTKEAEAADVLFAQAGEKFAAALTVKPDKHESLASWAIALSGQARTKHGDAADTLFAQAGEKFAAALAIKPDFHEALNNWGIALSAQASKTRGDAADALFAQAGEKYAAALAVKSDHHDALNNWGNALSAQARTKDGEAADALFAQAGEKYAAALAIKPDKHEALNNWAVALFDQAKTKNGEVAETLFAQAGEKFAAALAINPDNHDAFYNWGIALSAQARTRRGDAADALFALAGEKYAAALAIKPDHHDALNNWGNALMSEAETKHGDAADALFAQAGEKYAAALAIQPDKHEALHNWGDALSAQARTKNGDAADALFAQAGEKYVAALSIKPDHPDSLTSWGLALMAQAETKHGDAADALFALAGEKYAAALASRPDSSATLNNWGVTICAQARRKDGTHRQMLMDEAQAKFELAEKEAKGSAAYNLACLHALQGDTSLAVEWLRKSKDCGRDFPGCAHILEDGDFALVRDTAEFQRALAEIDCIPTAPEEASRHRMRHFGDGYLTATGTLW